MKDPVMSKDGKNFEKRAILDWLTRGNVNCPLTRQPLKPSLLVPNACLKLSIDQWKKDHGVEDTDDDESSTSSENDCAFVGLLQIDENVAAKNDNIRVSSSSRPHTSQNPLDDDLSDLLDLYNEVLELTATPFQSTPPLQQERRPRPRPETVGEVSSDEITQAAISAMVAYTARRKWRPKLFKNKS